MSTVTLKPADGRRVLNHQRGFRPLDPAGEPVEMDATWRKRLREQDVVEVTSDAAAPQATDND